MNPTAFISSLGSIGPFATRIFLPALISALLLRFGAHVPILHDFGLISAAHAAHAPTWFTSNTCIFVLTILTVLETLAQKNPEARRVLNEIDIYIKPVAAALCSFGVISATDAGALDFLGHGAHQAGMGNLIPPLLAAIGTFGVARVRRDVVTLVLDHIEGTHLDRLLSWGEEGFVIAGVFAWLVFPFLMLALIAIGTFLLARWRRRLRILEEQTRVPCGHCGTSIFPSAVACPSCKTPVPEPRAIGFLGTSKPEPDPDPAHHPLRLVEKKRCALCATHLKPGRASEKCHVCSTATFPDQQFAERYANYIASRLPTVLAVSAVLGLVPLLGLIMGAIYYRIELVLPFNEYLPMGRRFGLRIGLRILFFVLAVLQLIPVAGALVVPIMAMVSYTAYRTSFLSFIAKLHAGEELPGGAAVGGAAV